MILAKSMSTPIPEDVMDQARALVDVIEGMPSHGNVLLAARFLMAEREAADERAAKIAESFPMGKLKTQRVAHQVGLTIASAIRDRSKT